MPHLILEHSSDLADPPDPAPLFAELQQCAIDLVGFDPTLFKCRRLRNDFSSSGGQPTHRFVSLQLSILPGRDSELIQRLGQSLAAILHRHYQTQTREHPCDISVEVREISRTHYFKAG